jgi:DNA polymerase (family 10)
MKYNVIGSKGTEYTIDTEDVTCTCPGFKFFCKGFNKNEEGRKCRHLKEFCNDNPDVVLGVQIIEGADPDGKTRYPREKFEPYIAMIDHMVDAFELFIHKKLVCGSWRRKAQRVSDLDVLLVVKDVESFRQFQSYIEEMYAPTIRWKGDIKVTYVFDEFCQIDFKVVEEKHWPFATLHFTGSKAENIRLRKIAVGMGYSLSEYGLNDITSMDGGYHQYECAKEEDIYKFLNQPYKKPEER